MFLKAGTVATAALAVAPADTLAKSKKTATPKKTKLKVLGVGASYCTLLWLLRSAIFREAVRFVLKKGQLE